LSKTKEVFFDRLSTMMNMAKDSREIKRTLLEKLTASNLYPYTTFYLKDIKSRFGQFWKNHFSTIGRVGMNETCLNFLNQDITTKVGKVVALDVFRFHA
jgi:ribonucleoside-triphosphate reductase